jgi:uroporphyrinogen-III decarboxylase
MPVISHGCGNVNRIFEDFVEIGVDAYNPLEFKAGGFIFQSHHSVPSNVPGASYDDVVKLVREYGVYPLRLGEFDLAGLG